MTEVTAPNERLRGLGDFIRQQRELAGKSIRDLAKVARVSNPYISQIERGIRRPSAEILQQIARALEISSESLYVRAGILDPDSASADVESAIRGDARLSESQRSELVALYRRFLSADSGPVAPTEERRR